MIRRSFLGWLFPFLTAAVTTPVVTSTERYVPSPLEMRSMRSEELLRLARRLDVVPVEPLPNDFHFIVLQADNGEKYDLVDVLHAMADAMNLPDDIDPDDTGDGGPWLV